MASRAADIFDHPLIRDEERSMTAILLEDFGITHRRDPEASASSWRRVLIDRDGSTIGRMHILEAARLVIERRGGVVEAPA